ncbi:MAG: hypothetical protein WBY71_05570, partial [Nitrososphaeraceae archaeon]
ATHQKMPKPIYSSAGDGYFESFDFGESWRRTTTGLKHHYLYGLIYDNTFSTKGMNNIQT